MFKVKDQGHGVKG